MDLKIAFSKAQKSSLTNYKGDQLLVHTVLIIDQDLSNKDKLYTVYQWDSTFIDKWKERDIAESIDKAKAIIEFYRKHGKIGFEINPSDFTMNVDDQYENDCKVYEA